MKRVGMMLGRFFKGFGAFWWDFLVGDTPELTIVVLLILGIIAIIENVAHANVLAYVALPLLVISGLTLSVFRARKQKI